MRAGRVGVERGDRLVDGGAGPGSGRRPRASRPRAGPAPRSPRRTSRRGRPWRRGSTARPAAYRSRPAACFSRPSGASSSRRNRPNSAVAARGRGGAARPGRRRARRRPRRAARPARGRSCRRPGRSRRRTAWRPRAIWCRALTPARRAAASQQRLLVLLRAPRERGRAGPRCSRAASSPSVGIRSKTAAQLVQRRWRSRSARWWSRRRRSASSRPSRSSIASLATRSARRPARWRRARPACAGRARPGRRSPSGRQVGRAGRRTRRCRRRWRRRVERRPLVDVSVGDVIDSSHGGPYVTRPARVDPLCRVRGGQSGGPRWGPTPGPIFARLCGTRGQSVVCDRRPLLTEPRRALAARLPRAGCDLGLQLPVHQGGRRADLPPCTWRCTGSPPVP